MRDAFPDPVEPGTAARIRLEDAEYNAHGVSWTEAEEASELDPTRPSDTELMPVGHLHGDGHYCQSGACAITGRDWLCVGCQLMERDRTGRSYGK